MKLECEDKLYPKDSEVLEILHYPEPVLKQVAVDVEEKEFGAELQNICQNMLLTMYNEPGIGLAGPQVGISKRIFVMDVDYSRDTIDEDAEHYKIHSLNPRIFINPVIKNKEGEIVYEEGCLSLPGVFDEVTRSESLTVEYRDPYGDQHTLNADGLLSICIQHENDHLDGIVFIEHLSNLKFNLYRKKLIKSKKLSKQE